MYVELDALLAPAPPPPCRRQAARRCVSSLTWPTSGIMISGTTVTPSSRQLSGRLEDGARLHLVDLGVDDAEAAAAEAEHRVELGERRTCGRSRSASRSLGRGHLRFGACAATRSRSSATSTAAPRGRQELVQRRVEQSDRHRQPVHRPEDAAKSPRCSGSSLSSASRRSSLGLGEDHLLHDRQPVLRRRTCAPCGRGRCPRRRTRAPSRRRRGSRRWRARRGGASASAQLQQLVEAAPDSCGSTVGDASPTMTWPVAPSMVIAVAFAERARRRCGHLAAASRSIFSASQPTMQGLPMPRATRRRGRSCRRGGEDALGGDHAVDVVRRRLRPHEDHLPPVARPVARRGRRRRRPGRSPRPARPAGLWPARRA